MQRRRLPELSLKPSPLATNNPSKTTSKTEDFTMQKPTTNQVQHKIETFERNIVFRTARGYFLLMAVCAVLVFAAGIFFGLSSFVKASIPEPEKPALPALLPQPEPLTYASVKAWMDEQSSKEAEARQRRAEAAPLLKRDADKDDAYDPEADAELKELTALLKKLQALFPEPEYTWDDTYVETCAVKSPYGCLRYTRSVDREGVSRVVRAVIDDHDSFNETITTFRTLIAVLTAAPVSERASLILPTYRAYRDKHQDYLSQRNARENEIRRLEYEFEEMVQMYETKLSEQQQEKESQRTTGLYAIFAGLILLVLVSVFLVHFAIERHLRLLQTLVNRVNPTDGNIR